MILSRIKDLIPKVAQTLDLPEGLVAHVIAHSFSTLKDYIQYPQRAALRVPFLGVFRTSSFRLRHYLLKYIIPYYKQGKIPKERLQTYLKLRKIVRDDEQRRDFKTRFNLKYNPSWRQVDNSTETD